MEPLHNHDIAIVVGGIGGGMCLIIILVLVIVLARILKRYKSEVFTTSLITTLRVPNLFS